jgi:hypothetical protein
MLMTPKKSFATSSAVSAVSVMSDYLLSLAIRLEKLSPSRRNPEQYHIDKDEIIKAIRGLAKALISDHGAHHGAPRRTCHVRRGVETR